MSEQGTGPNGSLASLRELTELLLGTDDAAQALQHVADLAARTVPGNPEAGITVPTDHGPLTVGSTARLPRTVDMIQYELDGGPCLTTLRARRQTVVADTRTEDRWQDFPRQALALGVRSIVSFPLATREQVLGALNLYFTEPGGVDEQGETISELIADHAGLLLGAVLRNADQERMNAQLREALASRAVIDQAIGIVMAKHRIPADAAFALLRRRSQEHNRKLREVAAVIVEATGGSPPEPGAFRTDSSS